MLYQPNEGDETRQRAEEIRNLTKNEDGSLKLRNPNISQMISDTLYHIGLDSGYNDLQAMFGDVKFVCLGGTPKRMEMFAHFIMDEIDYKIPTGTQLLDISAHSYRYSLFKVGPILSVSHGMGIPSLGILLHELIKLMYHAKCKDPIFIRLGTCGGLGIDGGTVIVSEEIYDGLLRNTYGLSILGKMVIRPAVLDKNLANEILSLAEPSDEFNTILGKTMCTYDFYEGQGRVDGAVCDFTETDKMEYLKKLTDFGITNIEMETTIFAALTHHTGIKAAVICVAIVNRLNGDQVTTPKTILEEWQKRPQILVARFIKKQLKNINFMK